MQEMVGYGRVSWTKLLATNWNLSSSLKSDPVTSCAHSLTHNFFPSKFLYIHKKEKNTNDVRHSHSLTNQEYDVVRKANPGWESQMPTT